MQFFKAVQKGKAPKNPKENMYTRYAFKDVVVLDDETEVECYRSVTDDTIILDERFYDFEPATKEEVAEFYDNEDVDDLLDTE